MIDGEDRDGECLDKMNKKLAKKIKKKLKKALPSKIRIKDYGEPSQTFEEAMEDTVSGTDFHSEKFMASALIK